MLRVSDHSTYVYLVLVALTLFRVAVLLVRWMFPLVELEGARSRGVRTLVGTVLAGIFASLIYDVLKAVASA